MKEQIMKRLILSALAATLILVPTFQSQAAPLHEPSRPQSNLVQIDWKKPVVEREVMIKKKVVRRGPYKKVVVHKWRSGQRYANWKRYRPIEYRRYGLHRPARGQTWIRVDNDFLLVGIASGIIAGVVAAH
jgi:Ni/Co efflux regulator RcnB